MTTIVTTTSSLGAVLVADQGITGYLKHPDMNKIYVNDSWILSDTGTVRLGNILQYVVSYPEPPRNLIGAPAEQWLPWMVTEVVPAVQFALEEHLSKKQRSTLDGSSALLVTHGHAFELGEDLSITFAEPYWSIGSGAHVALGHLTANQYQKDWNVNHEQYAKQAIEAAQQYDPYTRGSINGYRSLPTGEVEKI